MLEESVSVDGEGYEAGVGEYLPWSAIADAVSPSMEYEEIAEMFS